MGLRRMLYKSMNSVIQAGYSGRSQKCEVKMTDNQKIKEHMTLVRLYQDGFVKGNSDEFEIDTTVGRLLIAYDDKAESFAAVLKRLMDGLSKTGYEVVLKADPKSGSPSAVGLSYGDHTDDGLVGQKGIKSLMDEKVYIARKVTR